jgi:hypothetical protein
MSKRLVLSLAAILLAMAISGCGGSSETGKNADQDKPKPVEKQ